MLLSLYTKVFSDFRAHILDLLELFEILGESEQTKVSFASRVLLHWHSIRILNKVAASRIRDHDDVFEVPTRT